ncbi:MAG: hypothetical protein KDK89_19515 [Alphaproteobacteria bacterium]|nr:hypothetical protein [Alphaproteobacteria bacterium]
MIDFWNPILAGAIGAIWGISELIGTFKNETGRSLRMGGAWLLIGVNFLAALLVYLLVAALAALVFNAAGIGKLGHPSLDFLVRPWAMPGTLDMLLMGTCGLIAAAGMWLLTNAYRLAPASLVTVFEYTGMIWAPLWGFLIFAEIPRWTTVVGTVIIVAAGIYAVRSATATERPAN